jgi:hypothetical protein
MLAEVISNIGNRIVTAISSEANVELGDESGNGRRYIWVLFVFEALRTNSKLWLVELSNVELDDARTREAICFPSVESTSGLYKEFRKLKSHILLPIARTTISMRPGAPSIS